MLIAYKSHNFLISRNNPFKSLTVIANSSLHSITNKPHLTSHFTKTWAMSDQLSNNPNFDEQTQRQRRP